MTNTKKDKYIIMKRLYKGSNKTVYSVSNKEGYKKLKLPNKYNLKVGYVFEIESIQGDEVTNLNILNNVNIIDYLPHTKEPIESIMEKIEKISNEYITSPQARILNNYFFKDEDFLVKFRNGIGGVSMHHNYIGGLAEHTLHVMNLSKILCELYHCRRKEIVILSAKLHDIGKIYELDFRGPFKYTLEGELEGHIAIGVQMLDRAFRESGFAYSEDFIRRVKGCIIQHHGKIEYGSPKAANMEESYILNFADSVDATLNRINIMKEDCPYDTWSEYEKKLDTRLYL